eukprot:297327_1
MNKLFYGRYKSVLLRCNSISKFVNRSCYMYCSDMTKQNVNLYDDRMDYVFVENLILYGYHGDLKEEKILGQKFDISLKLYSNNDRLTKVGKSDDLNDTMDYTVIVNEIEKIMKSTSYDMIEKLGNEIARNAFKAYGFDKLNAIQIKITKPNVPIPQMAKCVGVNIFRTANDFA